MFTGLIQEIGQIKKMAQTKTGGQITVSAPALVKKLNKGASIAVDGICLTVTELGENNFSADLSPETLSKTTARFYQRRRAVNLELPVAAGALLGGHLVSGHVDGLGRLKKIQSLGQFQKITIQIEPVLAEFLVEKGSVAVDGVSLTVNEVGKNFFSLTLIPETLKSTTLGLKKPGDYLNIETDLLLKPQIKKLQKSSGELSWATLEKAGFML